MHARLSGRGPWRLIATIRSVPSCRVVRTVARIGACPAASPLLDVPYALRHAAVSTWLRTAGDPARVAEWAGHSVAVLLCVYAKCIHGMEEEVLQRIWDATHTVGDARDGR